MHIITLSQAQTIVAEAIAHARAAAFKPLAVAVLDMRGMLVAYAAEDGSTLFRYDLAYGKAYGTLGMGLGGGALDKGAIGRPHFFQALSAATGGSVIPARGGVLIRGSEGQLLGAVGVSGDVSENDEAAALAGILAAGLSGDAG